MNTGIMPTWAIAITGDDYLIEPASQATDRLHRQIMKRTIRAVLLKHYAMFFRKHFERGNRSRYSHKPRHTQYRHRKKKKYGSTTDLVKTGSSQRHMTSQEPKIKISRAGATKGWFKGTMAIRWPVLRDDGSPMRTRGTKMTHTGVTWEQMNRELGNWHETEAKAAAKLYESLYLDDLQIELNRRPKLIKKYKLP